MAKLKKVDEYAKGDIDPVYVELAGRIRSADPAYTPYLLRKMFPLEIAKIVRELPAPLEELAAKFNLKKEELEKTLQELVAKGYLIKTAKGIKPFSACPQLNDIMMANPDYDHEHDEEFLTLLNEVLYGDFFCKSEYKGYLDFKAAFGKQFMRVIPKWKAIKDIPGVMPCEDMREIFKAYEGKLCNTRCICRASNNIRQHQEHFRKCAIHEGTLPSEGHCNHFGKIAEYYSEVMGFAPYLTAEQMLKSIEPLENGRTYHIGPNRRDVNFVCNCCECCNVAWPIRQLKPGRPEELSDVLAPSRFISTIGKEKCTGCGICETKCAFDAITIEDNKAHINAKRCFGCGNCVINCPDEALKLKLVRPAEHIAVEGGPSVVEAGVFEITE